jgi:hypothetical protein
MFQNRVLRLRRISRPKREEVAEGWLENTA